MCGGEKKKKEKKKGNTDEKKKKKEKKNFNWEMLSQYFYNTFTINFLSGRLLLANIGEKKIIFLEREKNNCNSMFKLKSV